jgi:hypothetical protein
MGNSSHQKGYRCYHLETEKFFISRDVVESVFPFSFPTSSHMSHSTSPSTQNEPYLFSTTAPITVSIQFCVHVSPRTYGPSPSTSPTADPIMNIDLLFLHYRSHLHELLTPLQAPLLRLPGLVNMRTTHLRQHFYGLITW